MDNFIIGYLNKSYLKEGTTVRLTLINKEVAITNNSQDRGCLAIFTV